MKRCMDLVISISLIILLSPLMVLVAAVIKIRMGSPVLFKQGRPGLGAQPFTLYKFRTMEKGELSDEIRLTSLGRQLRKYSLDELPQLVNVVKGEMSLVGPRPLLIEYLPLYNKQQSLRHKVKPGVTGWAQVNGRNAITWEEKFQLDTWYVNNQRLSLDLRILFLTIAKVVKREGINQQHAVTVEKFSGTEEVRQ
ncbi:sugar transferase [Lentibacillus sediminis]|uniref:sugar transferase n=1 Tax=Lentibacillus sediminis TaxID=1940529 RepID=UPI0023D8B6A5|nr:sugar transferase [Lentibacillus sediminis]